MATPSRGIGKGGKREGAGRPRGAISRRSRALLRASERDGLMPVPFLLSLMRDTSLPHRDRAFCAIAVSPYLHSKRAVVRTIPSLDEMDDEQLGEVLADFEKRAAAMSEMERFEVLVGQVEHLVSELPRLGRARQEALLDRVTAAADAAQQILERRHGPATRRKAAPPRDPGKGAYAADLDLAPQQALEEPAALSEGSALPAGSRWYYDPVTKTLIPR